MSAARPGLRERKKQQTRQRISSVGLALFAQRGYEHTTLAEIAEAADVSPRTIFAYFQSKEDILFCDHPAVHERLAQMLEQRPPGTTTVDALRDFLSTFPPEEQVGLRKRIIGDNETLRLGERARWASLEQVIARSIARDLGSGPEDIRPLLAAASVTAAFSTLQDRVHDQSAEPMSNEHALAILDEVLEFLRGGLEALRRQSDRAPER